MKKWNLGRLVAVVLVLGMVMSMTPALAVSESADVVYRGGNIYTMDESLTVIACGAGAISKIKDPFSDALTRIFNFKYPYEYISRFGEILERKDGIKELYEQFC